MIHFLRTLIDGFQVPAFGQTNADLRAKAVQQIEAEPATSTPEMTENGNDEAQSNVTQEHSNGIS